MPETPFTVELPDGSIEVCYSPSSVVLKYFTAGETLAVSDFLEKARTALTDASARVEAKFGFACTGATASLTRIESWGSKLNSDDQIKIVRI